MPAVVAFATLIGPAAVPRRHVASREKTLLDTVAHELRNPLTSLRLSLDMLINDFDELEPQAALRLVQRAQRSASWLQTLTENLTSAACVETGHLDVQPRTIGVLECLEQAVLLVHALLEQRNQTVRFTNTAACESRTVSEPPYWISMSCIGKRHARMVSAGSVHWMMSMNCFLMKSIRLMVSTPREMTVEP